MLQEDSPPIYPLPIGRYSLTQLLASFLYHRAFPFEGILGRFWDWKYCFIARIATPVMSVPPSMSKSEGLRGSGRL